MNNAQMPMQLKTTLFLFEETLKTKIIKTKAANKETNKTELFTYFNTTGKLDVVNKSEEDKTMPVSAFFL